VREAPPGHCTNCHAEFEGGNELCPPCSRAYVMGMARADGGDSYASYQKGLSRGYDRGLAFGVESENERLRRIFLDREDHGFYTLAEVVQALWPEPD
jgi:hypothetical protein